MACTAHLNKTYLPLLFWLCCLQPFFAVCEQRAWISLTDPNDIYNETVVAFLAGATDTIDALYDTHKSTAAPCFDVYSKIGNGDFKAQALPQLTSDKTVTLGIDAITSGPYLLRLELLENMDSSLVILLEDSLSGTLHNLRMHPHGITFHLDSAMNLQRFKLHFYPPFEFTSTPITCAGNPGAVHLSQQGSYQWNYAVKDADNVLIDSGSGFNGTKTLNNLEGGIYFITLQDNSGYTLTKHVNLEAKVPVEAQFEVSGETLQVGETLHFYDYSIGASSLSWDFGDGATLEGSAFPTHLFTQAGVYEVILDASNQDCRHTVSRMIQVDDIANSLEENSTDAPRFYNDGNNVTVYLPESFNRAQLEIYNLLGQAIRAETLTSAGMHKVILPEACPFCIYRITSDAKLVTAKFLSVR